jgi:hypothetical protein
MADAMPPQWAPRRAGGRLRALLAGHLAMDAAAGEYGEAGKKPERPGRRRGGGWPTGFTAPRAVR